jgi:hypothetical protein
MAATIGILGCGAMGRALAAHVIATGRDFVMSNSGARQRWNQLWKSSAPAPAPSRRVLSQPRTSSSSPSREMRSSRCWWSCPRGAAGS